MTEYFECLNGNRNVPHPLEGVKVNKIIYACYLLFLFLIPLKNILMFLRSVRRFYKTGKVPTCSRLVFISILGRESDVYYSEVFRSDINGTFVYIAGNNACMLKDGQKLIEWFVPKSSWPLLFLESFFFPQCALIVHLVSYRSQKSEHKNCLLEMLYGAVSGEVFYGRIVDYAIGNLLAQNHIKSVVLPVEGRNWERRLARISHKRDCFCIGYTPTLLTTCHHISKVDSNFDASDTACPDFMMVPGSYNFDVLARAGWPLSKIKMIGYLRDFASPLPNSKSNTLSDGLLVVLSGNYCTDRFVIEQVAHLGQSFRIAFRVNVRVHSSISIIKILYDRGLALAEGDVEYRLIFSKSATYIAEQTLKKSSSRLFFLKTPEPYCPNFVDLTSLSNHKGFTQVNIGELSKKMITDLLTSATVSSVRVNDQYFMSTPESSQVFDQLVEKISDEVAS